jgi:anti-sigma factor RsiW
MSSFFRRHSDRDLVRYLDGELSARKAGKVERHLESCGQCRAELEELKDTLAECARYQDVLDAQSPEAPQPWRDLYRDFSRIDESLANTSLLGRLMRPLVHSGAPRWAFVTGLAALIVLVSLHQLRQAPSVQAASILRKAVAVSESQPRPARHIRVRTSHRQEFTRLAGAQASLIQVAAQQAVAAQFQAANFDWNDPLSARAFEQWRDEQVHKTDEVTTVPNPQVPSSSCTRIRTAAAEGELAQVSITLDAGDYRPLEEMLEFRDREWIELSEISENSTDIAGGTLSRPVESPVRAAEPPSRPAAFAPGSSASISDELQVLSALNSIGADLGDPVEVSLAGGKVLVTGGEGIPPRRQNDIRASVADLPHVEVEFSPSRPATVPAETAVAGGGVASAPASPMQARLEKHLGGHAEFDRFSTQLLDLNEAAMQRVYALHRLSQKISPEDEAQLSSKDLNVLHEISRKHTAVLAEKVSGMERILVPTLSALGGTAGDGTAAGVSPTSGHTTWQPAAEDVYKDARRVEVLVSQMLGMTPGNPPNSALPSELMAALKDLQGNLDECRKFLQVK